MMREYWKFLQLDNGKIVSNYDTSSWTVGEWRETEGEIEACENGFHCSPNPLDAFGYVNGGVVARVEVDGESHAAGDKSAHQRMRITRAWRWTADDSVQLAIFAAEQVIAIYEEQYPHDDRPRKAIEAGKTYLSNPAADAAGAAARAAGAAARAAARAAGAAAYAAADAAYAAARAAYAAYAAADAAAHAAADAAAHAAADAAGAAARAAADAAHAAADAAGAAAYAAHAAAQQRIAEWMCAHIETLTVIG